LIQHDLDFDYQLALRNKMTLDEKNTKSLRDFLHFLCKRKRQILVSFFVIVGIVTATALLMKPIYESQGQILVKIGRENVYVPATENLDPVVSFDRREQINSEIEILKSRSLAQKTLAAIGPTLVYPDLKNEDRSQLERFLQALKNKIWSPLRKLLRLKSEPRSLLQKEEKLHSALLSFQKSLRIEVAPRSNLINIKFRHEDPYMSAEIANKLASIYLDHHLAVHKPHKSNTFFRQQAEFLKQKIQKSEEKLETLKKKYNITSFEEQREILLRQTAQLRIEVNRTLSQEAEIRNRIAEFRHQQDLTPETITQEKEVHHNPYLISNLQARLVELELNEKQLLTKYKDGSRLVKNVREEIKLVREKLSEHENKQYGRTRSGINPTYQRLKDEILQNEAELRSLKARRKTLSNQLKDYQSELGKLNQIEIRHNQFLRELEVDQQNYQLYLTKFEESRISDAMDTEKISNVSLVEPAQPPLEPVGPGKKLIILLGLFLGVFGGLSVAFFMEFLDDSFERPEDVEHFLEAPVLTSIPNLKVKKLA
jgi:uncharacterized protein involved in exopolysaccharide biosynthesis